jgi:hypothetical protein
MKWHKLICPVSLSVLTAVTVIGCTDVSKSTVTGASTTRPDGWTEETHGNKADPNYEVVFPQESVNQIKITVTAEDWSDL